MLIIRDAQLTALAEARRKNFVLRVMALIEKHWTEQAGGMGEAALRDLVERGIAKANSYNIDDESDVARFINVQMALGQDFDSGSKYPWAAIILLEEAFTGSRKTERICDFARETLERMHKTKAG
jgi:hypothetical protein